MKKLSRKRFIIGALIVLIPLGILLAYRFSGQRGNSFSYVTAKVKKGTLIVSVSGTGQVLASNQLDIKPKVSGDVDYIAVKNGQEVKKGQLIIRLDTSEAERAVRQAQDNLETAKLELEKLLSPPDQLTLLQAENALIQAQNNLEKLKINQENERQNATNALKKAEDNLNKAYEDGFNAISNAFLDLPAIMSGLNNILYSQEIAMSDQFCISGGNTTCLINAVPFDQRPELTKFIDIAMSDYKNAREKYDKNFEEYKNTSRYSQREVIETLLSETIETSKSIAQAIKSISNMLDYWVDLQTQNNGHIFAKVREYQTTLISYTSKANNHLSNLLAIQRVIEDSKEAKLNAQDLLQELEKTQPLDLAQAERKVKEQEEYLAKLKSGPDELEIKAKKIAVQQREDALLDAKQNLENHFIYAPFDGIIANINVKKGDSVSVGTIITTLITKEKIAQISLNEIDIAKVKIGQKANITFDAIDDLNLVGEVVEVDTIGQVSQGVVSYNVKIAFDTQDERIKPGMSVSASIIVQAKPDVLLVPNSAIKKEGERTFVQLVVDKETIKKQEVKVGLSNETMTEIVEGLKEGDVIVSQTITQSSNQIQRVQRNQGFNPGMMRMMR